MSISTWALAREYIDSKMSYILLSYLNTEIANFNAASGLGADYQVPNPMQNVVGVDSIRLQQTANAIEFPAVTVYEVGSRNTVNSIVDSQDDVITYELVAAIASDAGSVAWAAKTAKYLALCAMTVMERNLPDSPGQTTNICAMYRVDPVSTAQSRTVPIKTGHLYMSAFAVRFDVYTRVLINYAPALLPPTLVLDPWVDSVFDPVDVSPPVATDLLVVLSAGATPNASTAVSISATDLGLTTTINFDTTGLSIPAGSEAYIVNQNTFETVQVTASATSVDIPVATVSISDGDLWIVIIKHSVFNTPLTYPLRFTVTV
jgi:hypothetical protein